MDIGTATVLNMIPGGVMPIVCINQYDKGYQRKFQLYNGAKPFNIASNQSVTIRGTKGDGHGIVNSVQSTMGSNEVSVTITEQMTAVKGAKNIYELRVVNNSGLVIGTANFIMFVERAALDDDTIISDSDLSYANDVYNNLQSVQAYKNQLDNVEAQLQGNPYQMPYIKGDDSGLAWQHLVVTPQMFGAKGDGITDDTAAFQSAINQFGTLFVPSGSYVVNGLVLKEGTKIVGENEFDTIIVTNGFNTRTGNEDISRMAFSNLTFIGNGTCLDLSGSTTSPFTGGRYAKLKNLTFRNFTVGILERGCWCVSHENLRFINCGTAVRQEGTCNNIVYDHCIINGSDPQTQTGIRIVSDGGSENYNIDFLSCNFEKLDKGIDAFACVSMNVDNPYVEKVTTFLNATNLIGAKGNGGNFNGIRRLLNLTKTDSAFFANTGIQYDTAYVKLDSGDVVAYPTSGTYADLKNFVGQQKMFLSYLDADSLSECSGNYDTEYAESNEFNIRYTSSVGSFSTPRKRRFESFKTVSASLVFTESATTERDVQVEITNNNTAIGTAIVRSGNYSIGDTVTVGLDTSVLGNRIMDDLTGLSVRSTNSASSSDVKVKATLSLVVAEMMTRTV